MNIRILSRRDQACVWSGTFDTLCQCESWLSDQTRNLKFPRKTSTYTDPPKNLNNILICDKSPHKQMLSPSPVFDLNFRGRRAERDSVDGIKSRGTSPERRAARFVVGIAVRVWAVVLCHRTVLSEQNIPWYR